MSNILPFTRLRSTNDVRSHVNDCAHRHIRLAKHAGIVSCADCGSALTPFSALSILAEQYGLALSQIEHLKDRLALADARILELSETLDAIDNLKRAPKQPSTDT
ncbi:hypothetical protein IAG25_28405 [Caballeronia sp. EK]|jgi:hypothetical protein|uniref:hypothetical protein n=1 Tax=Caballeronia sp. EK TaxID=2767469 RepID=UPI0016565145|nr:hypothetical protein [Caballeronia sp. EK]MBC8640744.1 hypothetical protein [Caballeronia sp. EK]